ncbi:NmrA-like domain-containing protein [Mycena metata]|uniref:NmrA-like domain-containing protein n=1 Tax=Mycena metata TaxID=1033252 RepID=A0AAD7JIN8_9AGAR|nr:NmrA-like domain-containing protein [Mycena metata]
MSALRIVAVFSATGLQGSAVINRLLEDGSFTPRAITRDTKSEASLKLKERGVEVVQGDSADKASLVSALRRSEAVFAVTSPGATSELTQGKNIIDAAKEADVKFLVFSSLPSLSKLSSGKYNIPSYDDKAEVEVYLKASGLPNASLLLGGFAENFWKLNFLKKTSTGFNITLPKYSPTAVSAFTWIGHDLGEAALAVLKNYEDPSKEVSGKSYPVVTAQLTLRP